MTTLSQGGLRSRWQAWVEREIGGSAEQIEASTDAAMAAIASRRSRDEVIAAARAARPSGQSAPPSTQQATTSATRPPRPPWHDRMGRPVGPVRATVGLLFWAAWAFVAPAIIGPWIVGVCAQVLPVVPPAFWLVPTAAALVWLTVIIRSGYGLYAYFGALRFFPAIIIAGVLAGAIIEHNPVHWPPQHVVVVPSPQPVPHWPPHLL